MLFGTKINNAEISNAEINSAGNSNAWFIFIKCLVYCFQSQLVFGLKLFRILLSNYTLELLCNWVKVNNYRTNIIFYGLLTSYEKNNFVVMFTFIFHLKLFEDK